MLTGALISVMLKLKKKKTFQSSIRTALGWCLLGV